VVNAPAWITATPIAHRGLHDRAAGAIENSPAAASAAIARGFAIECDVQLTADGDAMVFHDFELGRLTGETGAVAARNAADLAKIALKDSRDTIPTLSAFLSLIAGRVPLVLEIKSRFDGDLRLTQRTCAILETYPGPVAIKSFDPAIVVAVRRLAPQRPRGIVAQLDYSHHEYASVDAGGKFAMANILHLTDSEPDFLSWRVRDLPCGVAHLWRRGMKRPVMSWTVRTAADRALARAHADQMVFEGFLPE
jgi:glycerophosphoryl diester phosphodiesterase